MREVPLSRPRVSHSRLASHSDSRGQNRCADQKPREGKASTDRVNPETCGPENSDRAHSARQQRLRVEVVAK